MARTRSPSPRSRAVLALCAGLATVGLSACGSSSSGTASGHDMSTMSSSAAASSGSSSSAASSGSSSSSSTGQAAAATTIHITGFRYEVPASVSPGATVTVMNMDGEAHTATSDTAGAFDVNVAGGKAATFTAPTKPGSYDFHCLFHGNMTGKLVVK